MLQAGDGALTGSSASGLKIGWLAASIGRGSAPGRHIYSCQGVEIDSLLGCVRRGGQEYYLRQQCFQVLLYILEQRERLVSKDELIENFWHDTAVTDNAVVQCVAEIRRALGDDPRDPRFIKTIPKAGYRFIAPVIREPAAAEPVKDPSAAAIIDIPGRSQGLHRWTALGLAALAVLAAMGWALAR